MFRASVEIDQDSDIDAVVNSVTEQATNRGVQRAEIQEILGHLRQQVEPIVDRGKNLFAMGSKMSVNTVVKGTGYEITVKARFGIRDSFWRRLFGLS